MYSELIYTRYGKFFGVVVVDGIFVIAKIISM